MIGKPITVCMEPREDGGLRVWSDDLPGLILSGPDQVVILRMLGDVIVELLRYRAQRFIKQVNDATGD